MERRLGMAALVGLSMLAGACEREGIEVSAATTTNAYGRADLLAAVDRFAASDHAPEQYRTLAVEIERLAPRFNALVAAEAELNLAFLALEPLDAHWDAPPDQQLAALALTVWPTALGEPPAAGEDAWAYSERLCGGPLASECKQIVPEHRALLLSHLVWNRFKQRARESLRACKTCDDPRYTEAIARFEERDSALTARAGEDARRAHPKHWPIAGEHAAPWSSPPLVTVHEDGTARFAGRALPPGAWSEALGQTRGDTETLGVWAPPGVALNRLRTLARAARAAGFRAVAIQTREPRYPYEAREYRLALGRRSTVRLQADDSVQLLINALDAALAEKRPLPTL